MKILSIIMIVLISSAFAQEGIPETTTRGTDPSGTGDMAPDAYPNSGQTRARSSNIMGHESSSMEETSTTAQGAEEVNQREQTPLDMKEGYVDQVADSPTENSFENALSQGKTQTGPYKTTGEIQSQEEPEAGEESE